MKILVTGASGFIGAYVVREAIARGHDVIALTRSKPASEPVQASSLAWLQCDLGDVKASKLERLRIDAVIHLAASLSGNAEEQYRSTVIATRHLLDAMKQAGISRLVGVSSIAVLDYAHIPAMAMIDENVRISDGSETGTYTEMKLEQEKLFTAFAGGHGTRCAVLRPGLVYDSERLINARAGVIKGPLCLVAFHGGHVPTVEVTGLARAILNACERDVPDGEIIQLVDDNLPSQREYLMGLRRRGILPSWGIPVSWRLLAAMAGSLRVLFHLAGQEARLPEAFRQQGFAARFKPFRYSNEKAKRLLGWIPASRFS